jgi:sugar/nucleoside kinase (ribokinase family)
MASYPRVDVTGVGANSVDYVAVLPAFPQPSAALSKVRMQRHAVMCGGQMATALATCARLGLRSRYVGATGDDANGRLVRDTLGRLDIDVSHLVIHEASNQFAFVLIDERSGERVIFWDRDERLNLDDRELPPAALVSARLVHVDDTDERAAIAAARIARARGLPVTSDIDRVTDRTPELIESVTVAIFAQNVPIELAGGRGDQPVSPGEVADALGAMPRRQDQVLCATLGSRGAVALDEEGAHHQPAFSVPVTDTTGAGDVFRGAFIYARLQGWRLDEQLRFANAAAAISCTRLGALASVPSLGEVEKLLREAQGTG